MEGHVEQHEDDEEDDRQQHLQALACPNLKLVLSRPRQRVSDRDLELTLNGQPRLGYIAADVAGRGVDVDVAGQLAVLVTDHRRAWSR